MNVPKLNPIEFKAVRETLAQSEPLDQRAQESEFVTFATNLNPTLYVLELTEKADPIRKHFKSSDLLVVMDVPGSPYVYIYEAGRERLEVKRQTFMKSMTKLLEDTTFSNRPCLRLKGSNSDLTMSAHFISGDARHREEVKAKLSEAFTTKRFDPFDL